ncbi:uncharacterized protein LOC130677593 isoform X2 [Microplitis mediator]|uniref:uncharacterized protein LOC130677593 isoform X2 n=1 Tax=Microplitis mediator TaxID=375433 RepID=UPI0025545554|nr:uncharacterized protein LOC130677593 isoform X2 [Microplitis mediator]
MKLLILFCFINCVLSLEEKSPRIIIVGSGAAGIAAASKLLQNGFNNITILEAENRIGGRVYSVQIGEYLADLGGQWVVGEVGNVAFELAWPLGLLQKSTDNKEWNSTLKIFGSSGEVIPESVATPLAEYLFNIAGIHDDINNLKSGSFGEYAEMKLNEYFENHPEITADKRKPLLHFLDMCQMSDHAAASWHDVSAKGTKEYASCEGDQAINWRRRTYSTILDILMKKYPNPEDELPVKNITKLNTKVFNIHYDETPIKVTTTDGREHLADHVIFTPSLGVLQKNYNRLFSPSLPTKKLNAIRNLSMGHVAKIIVYYTNPWWLNEPILARGIYWTEEDRKEIENDPQKRWMLGVSTVNRVEHKPKLVIFWVTGSYVHEMEALPETIFQEQVKHLIRRFFEKTYSLTEPTLIVRTTWNTNENFLGTWSYRGVQADVANAQIEDYEEPIMQNDKPVLLFAGEGTSVHYGMIHGAIETGWREADRIIMYHSKKKSPRIIVVGSGASGIAAASRLLQNGFNDITILEAENRIGGRVYSVQIGEYLADLGGQWVTGEVGNVVFELAWPLGLLQKSDDNKEWNSTLKIFGSSGQVIPENVATSLIKYLETLTSSMDESIHLKTGSLGEYVEIKLNEYFKRHPEITTEQQQPLLRLLDLMEMVQDAGKSWHEVSAEGAFNYKFCEGDQAINWRTRTYSMILDILTKKYPNPEDELPVKKITKLNTKVYNIHYDETPIKVTTTDGREHLADHVIFTPSLGVLKKNYNHLFSPSLPERKLNAIKNLSFGGVAKIILYYENPWWLNDPIYLRSIYWTEEDRKELENNRHRKWMLGVSTAMRVEHKPKLLLIWVSGPYVREMELTPEELFKTQVNYLIWRFFDKAYNITAPTVIKRTTWNTNENFLGTYSFRGVQDYIAGARIEDYAAPIQLEDKPVLLFAGEGTSDHYGMVNGAIEAGWREADRLINYYNPSPRIIIVGSGASGIAAASRLLENGFNNIAILEAENRMGGRVYSVEIGAEWVHGEKDNVAFELAWPLGLLERFSENTEFKFGLKIFGSSGQIIPEKIANPLQMQLDTLSESIGDNINSLKTGSLGEYAERKFNTYFMNHPEITTDQHKPLLHLLNLMEMVMEAAESWNEVSATGEYEECEGDQVNNWKERTYWTILDILMKKYPNPEEELPVKSMTQLNTKVYNIHYDETPIKVTTTDGRTHLADHVIFTPSLGVLQKNYNTFFSPPLPEKKLNAIKNLSFGRVAKIIVYYENPWWLDDPIYMRAIYWTEEDRKEIENDPPKKWMLGVSLGMRVEHRPKLLLFWVTGRYVRHMELTPEVFFQEQVKELITKFFGKAYNLTEEPTIIKRSLWATNENFLGTYSYRGVQANIADAHIEDYAEPIIQDNKPVLQFAGEATTAHHSTVHGAIDSGWREADRLINYYNKQSIVKKKKITDPQISIMYPRKN